MFQFFRGTGKEFRRRWGAYIIVVFLPLLIITRIILPFYQWLAEGILTIHGIPYLAHSTMKMFGTHPTSIVLLILLAVLILLTVFYQFSFTLIGIRQIINDCFSFKSVFRESWDVLLKYGLKSLPGLLFYFVLLMPVAGLTPYSQIFAKISLPNFIVNYMINNVFLALLLLAGYIVLIYIGIRRIYTLPLMILEKKGIADAFKKSEQITKGHKRKIFLTIFVLSLVFAFVPQLIYTILYRLQMHFDTLNYSTAMISATVIMSVIQLVQIATLLFSTIYFLFLIIPKEYRVSERAAADQEPASADRKKAVNDKFIRKTCNRISGIVIGIVVFFLIIISFILIFSVPDVNIKVISHRGSDYDTGNGVQNTTSTMLKTFETAYPDYTEMDIHETKDNKFIVFHDESLNALCGVDKVPHDLTLDELKQLTVSEMGFTDKMSTFDDYLAAANEAGQKLLIEIKTTPYDSPDYVERFVKEYGDNIQEHGHIMHTMDYDVIREISGGYGADKTEPIEAVQAFAKGKDWAFFNSAIVPYNLIYAGTSGQAVTMEETFVDTHLIRRAHELGQEVYVWTVNEEYAMEQMIFLGVDGIITDRPSALRDILNDYYNDPSFASRIRFFISDYSIGV